ncbi:MAG: MBL fold metallo-hydrolase [Thermoanaerobaculia bacterium]
MRKTILLGLCSLLLTLNLAAQQDFSKVEMRVIKVAGSVYMLQGAGGNIGVSVFDDGFVVVDDQYAPLVPKIKEALKGITTKPMKFIINTHYHGDHTGGNAILGQDAPIIAHDNVRKRLQSGATLFGQTTPPAAPAALPVITFNDHATLYEKGEEIHLTHVPPGHTDGDTVVDFKTSRVVHMGDDFFNGMFPFVDLGNGGSVRGMLATVDATVARIGDDTKVIPGHGELSDKAGLRAFADMLRGTLGAVQTAMKAGKNVEQMKKENVLVRWASWGKGFINTDHWIETLAEELKKKK